MLILFNNLLKIKQLKTICKLKKIKISDKNKKKLLTDLNIYNSTLYIQKFLRRKLMTNDVCPITLNKLIYPFISLKSETGHFYYYQLKDFGKYIIKSKKWENPMTREQIKGHIVKQISDLHQYYYKKELVKKVASLSIDKFRLHMLYTGRCAIDYTNSLYNIDLTDYNIDNIILPRLMNYIYYLNIADRIYCTNITCTIISKLLNHSSSNKNKLIDNLAIFIS